MTRLFSSILVMLLLSASASAAAQTKLKIGTLPIADTLILHVAQRDGFFKEVGLEVELIPFQSFVEKNAAVQSGELDGHFSEISAVIIQRAAGLPYVVIAITSHTSAETRMFGLITSPKKAQAGLEQLEGLSLATSRLAIVDFLADVFLEKNGKKADFMKRQNLPKIPVRMQMLISSQVDAAVLPEPLLSIAEKAGGRVLLDDRELSMPLAVVALRDDLATFETVRSFQSALTKAGLAINKDPKGSLDLLLKLRLIPPQLAESYPPPYFDMSIIPESLPGPGLYEMYTDWLVKNKVLADKEKPGGLPLPPPYEQAVWPGSAKP